MRLTQVSSAISDQFQNATHFDTFRRLPVAAGRGRFGVASLPPRVRAGHAFSRLVASVALATPPPPMAATPVPSATPRSSAALGSRGAIVRSGLLMIPGVSRRGKRIGRRISLRRRATGPLPIRWRAGGSLMPGAISRVTAFALGTGLSGSGGPGVVTTMIVRQG